MRELPRLEYSGAVDGDGHILEPPDLWTRYMEPRYRDRALRIRQDDRGLEYLEIDGRHLPRLTFDTPWIAFKVLMPSRLD